MPYPQSHCLPITAVLIRSHDIPGSFMAWCPELDVFTQGDHADHAVMMLGDAIRIVVEDDLSHGEWAFDDEHEVEFQRKRVVDPRRRSGHAGQCEYSTPFEQYRDRTGEWSHQKSLDLACVDGMADELVMVSGNLSWFCRSGVVVLDIDFHSNGRVPAERFEMTYGLITERTTPVYVPRSVLTSADMADAQVVEHAQSILRENETLSSIRIKRST